MTGKGMLISEAAGRGQPRGPLATQAATQATTAKRRPVAAVSLLRLTALRLLYQAIRTVEDAELCEAGL